MIILGLGSNLRSSFGDRFKNIELAILHLKFYKIKVLKISSFYETPSYPDNKNPRFINVVIEISTNLTPINLAPVLIFIEKKLERKRNRKNDPRTCDIDIIDYNGKIINFKYKNLDFIVPHEELIYRNFVLIPLKEILPNWHHPKTKESIDLIIDRLSNKNKKSILKVSEY
jgi:2-amino-4-hydroxy-6-hydroxymethyldihydropteridine diphosphokinase